ncbi:MAG TPA: hypothetical protein VK745_27760 [Polyangiaceae bacterium]|jgi:hypothetical protein|nr:hypothetical protein [Polyangiaceae bacterium]
MRIRGRRLYPSTLSERRVMMSLGGTPLYAPRGVSPYLIARRIARGASGESGDVGFVREVLARSAKPPRATAPEPVVTEMPVEAEASSGQGAVAA